MLEMKANVWLGSEKQVSYGILANATLGIYVDDVHLVDLREWKIRQTKNGLAALPPSRNAGPDKRNPGKDRYINYYGVFPGDIDTYKKAQQTILDEYYSQKEGSGHSRPSNFPSAAENTTEAPRSESKRPQEGNTVPVPPPMMSKDKGTDGPPAKGSVDWPYGEM